MPKQRLILVCAVIAASIACAAAYFAARDRLSPQAGKVKIVDFIEKSYPIEATAGADVRAEPSATAAQVSHLRQGVPVKVIGVVEGNDWLSVELPDNSKGFVAAAAIPAITPGVGSFVGDGSAVTDTATMEFVPYDAALKVAKATKAYAGSSTDAPVFYPVRAGTAVQAAAKSKDGKWVIVMTEDGRAAYLQMADLREGK
jgi:hypothetical protein